MRRQNVLQAHWPGKVTQEDLVQLLTYLPRESASRDSADEAACFTTGEQECCNL